MEDLERRYCNGNEKTFKPDKQILMVHEWCAPTLLSSTTRCAQRQKIVIVERASAMRKPLTCQEMTMALVACSLSETSLLLLTLQTLNAKSAKIMMKMSNVNT
jgi:hypothetical protein